NLIHEFEIKLYEGRRKFEFLYSSAFTGNGTDVAVGVQEQANTGTRYTSYLCDQNGLSQNLRLTFTLCTVPTDTRVPTRTHTRTPTSTRTPTPTTCPTDTCGRFADVEPSYQFYPYIACL